MGPRGTMAAAIVALALGGGCALLDGLVSKSGQGIAFDTDVLPASFGADGMVVVDVNGDGHLDLVDVEGGSNLEVRLGHGDRSFDAPIESKVDAAYRRLQPGDFNGDGVVDLVGVTAGVGGVIVLIGDGSGTFAALPFVGFGTNDNDFVAVGRLGPEPQDDLVVSERSDQVVQVLRCGADGTPAVSDAFPTNIFLGGAAIFAADGNAQNDLVYLEGSGLYFADGSPDGTLAVPRTVQHIGGNPAFLTAGDLDGDGRPDLAAVVDSGNGFDVVGILVGIGNASESSRVPRVGADQLAIGDVDGDGHSDVAGLNGGTQHLAILLGDGLGDLSYDDGHNQLTLDGQPSSFAVGDLDEDGAADVVIAMADQGRLELFYPRR